MKRTCLLIIILIVVISLFIPKISWAQDCPEGFKCIPEETASQWKKALKERQCQDEVLDQIEKGLATPNFKLTHVPYQIIVTKKGQVFSQDLMTTQLTWCETQLSVMSKTQVQVRIRPEKLNQDPVWGFRLRARLGVNVQPKFFFCDDTPLFEPILAVEPFFVKHFHVITWAGLNTFGVGAGMDMTRNANVFVGVGGKWLDASVGPVLGLSLSFN